MSYFRIAPDLSIAVAELNYLMDCLDENGFRAALLNDMVSPGLIKNKNDLTFSNGRVLPDTPIGSTQCCKILPLYGVDESGNFLNSPNTISQIQVPSTGAYWLQVQHQFTNVEPGYIVSLGVDGTLVGSGTNWAETMVGMPSLPSKIRITNSVYNTLEYEVLQIIDSEHLVLANPSSSVGGLAEFAAETVGIGGNPLLLAQVGVWTPGIAVSNPYPYQRDSISYSLVQETTLNNPPSGTGGTVFNLARIYVSTGGDLVIQDKRESNFETKGSQIAIDIDRSEINPLIGIESSQWEVPTAPGNTNIVTIGYGFRSTSWSISSSSNVLTISAGVGGRYKSVNDVNNNDFTGWRVYTGNNGTYSMVVSCTKVGGAVNLLLDVLDPDNYTNGDGVTPIAQTITIAPDCSFVEVKATSNPADNVPSVTKCFIFAAAAGFGKMDLEVYKTTAPVLYNVQYRYLSLKEATGFLAIPSDITYGYLTEVSYDQWGNLLSAPDQVRYPYVSAPVNGFIQLTVSPTAYSLFQGESYLGDKYGIYNIPSLTSNVTYNLLVGTAYQTQCISGVQSIAADTTFNLENTAVNGNIFKVIFNCSSLNLNGFSIYFKQGTTSLKQFTMSDVYCMLNKPFGITFTFTFDGTVWHIEQDFDYGVPQKIEIVDGVLSSLFDTSVSPLLALGKVQGLWGYALCNSIGVVNDVNIPNMSRMFLMGQGEDAGGHVVANQSIGGNVDVTLVVNNLPNNIPIQDGVDNEGHAHSFTNYEQAGMGGSAGGEIVSGDGQTTGTTANAMTGIVVNPGADGSQPIDITNQYYSVIYCKKLF